MNETPTTAKASAAPVGTARTTVAGRTLVGREPEQERIARALASVISGEWAGLAFIGEAGIGKTTLLDLACSEAAGRALTVIRGRGSEFDREAPFAVLIDALDEVLGARGSEWLEDLGPGLVDRLVPVFPSLAGLGAGPEPLAPARRYTFDDAIRIVLTRIAEECPLILALDDLHRADQESIRVLARLISHGVRAPVLAAIAYRPTPRTEGFGRALAGSARDGRFSECELEPLREPEVRELIEGASAARIPELLRETGGNPFYLLESARRPPANSTPEPGPTDTRADEIGGRYRVPRSITTAVSRELDGCSQAARSLAESGSVLEEPFDAALAGSVAELEPKSAYRAVDELAVAGLFRTSGVPGHCAFRYPVLRRAAYALLSPGRRWLVHARAAAALERRRAPVWERADHVANSAPAGDWRAIELLDAAAHRKGASSPAAAARWLASALRLLPADASSERRAGLIVRLAWALGRAGRASAGRDALGAALTPFQRGDDPGLSARILRATARLEHLVGRHREVGVALGEACRGRGAEASRQASALLLEGAINRWLADDFGGTAQIAARARTALESDTAQVDYASACALEAIGEGSRGGTEKASARAVEAAQIVDQLPDAGLAAGVEVLLLLGQAELHLERIEQGADHLERGVRISDRNGERGWLVQLTSRLALARLQAGSLDRAEAAAERSVRGADRDHPQLLAAALSVRAWVQLVAGDPERARVLAEKATAALTSLPTSALAAFAHGCLALTLLEAGEARQARDELLRHGGGVELAALDPGWRVRWFAGLAAIELELGAEGAAVEWVERAEAQAHPLNGRIAEACRARARLALARSETGLAASKALEARNRFESVGFTLDAGLTGILAGEAAAADGDPESAVELLQRAERQLARCGASRRRDEAKAALRRIGPATARRATGDRGRVTRTEATLSPREVEIAKLVGEGLTNRQIAERLYLSVKTIETHLSHAYAKLGVSSRAALAVAVNT